MGARGPVPKRADERRGHRAAGESEQITKADGAQKVRIPAESKDWHPIARRIWRAAKVSGQSRFYEPSDWAILWSLMEDLSDYKQQPRRSGQMLATIMASLSSLLLTEGDRRRLQIELSRPEEPGAQVSAGVEEMAKWRERLKGKKVS